ncbi:hypothetical protein CMO84_07935 [Candidatus Woesearchaeota archaeon]|nr:hypothetical protein [Candidatus Woesearchaeota archaeon]
MARGRTSARCRVATTVGSKALFVGDRERAVDVYDATMDTWSTATLSQARRDLAATSVGTKALFAGGSSHDGDSNRVDIYDSVTGSWSTARLSQARRDLAATSVGTKALFAGGMADDYSKRVDIYDAVTDTWSTATLSQARQGLAATSVGTKALFAGGWTGRGNSSAVVDIYDASMGQWSTAQLSQARTDLAATTVGSKALFAGGSTGAGVTLIQHDVVDIYDATTDAWSTVKLSQARSLLTTTTVGTKALFAGGLAASGRDFRSSARVDIYDAGMDTTIPQQTEAVATPTGAIQTRAIGQSAGGRPLEAILVGNGSEPVIFVGALQGGAAPNTRDLVQQVAAYYTENPTEIPPNVTALFVPALNPDGLADSARPNSRGIYLSNNWDIRWSPDPDTPEGRKSGGGGTQAFSEPESRALRDLVLEHKARAVIFFQAAAPSGLVIPGEGPGTAEPTISLPLAELLSQTLGFRLIRTWSDRTITGDPSDWLDREGVMSVIVLLPTNTDPDFDRQKQGLAAAMQLVSQRQEPPPQ